MSRTSFNPASPTIKFRVRDKSLKARIVTIADKRNIDPTDLVREGVVSRVEAEENRLGIVPTTEASAPATFRPDDQHVLP